MLVVIGFGVVINAVVVGRAFVVGFSVVVVGLLVVVVGLLVVVVVVVGVVVAVIKITRCSV